MANALELGAVVVSRQMDDSGTYPAISVRGELDTVTQIGLLQVALDHLRAKYVASWSHREED